MNDGLPIKKGCLGPIKDNGTIISWAVQWSDFNGGKHTRRWDVDEHGHDEAHLLATNFVQDNRPK